jgi:hypothetical protein
MRKPDEFEVASEGMSTMDSAPTCGLNQVSAEVITMVLLSVNDESPCLPVESNDFW